MQQLEVHDMQGLLVRGYGNLPNATYLMLKFEPGSNVAAWLNSIVDQIAPGRPSPEESAVNVAFTHDGFQKIGLGSTPPHADFSPEFVSGMAQEHRSRAFGDTAESAPDRWAWGRPDDRADAVLMLFAKSPETLSALETDQGNRLAAHGIRVQIRLDTSRLDGREHFGFVDGISQPFIEGLSDKAATEPPANVIKAGEFILGYPNEYDQFTERPMVALANDPAARLPRAPNGLADFGRNGTYLVFRTLQQDPIGFHRFLNEATTNANGDSNAYAQELLAAKMVGRWRSGAPLVETPLKDDPSRTSSNGFSYFAADAKGFRCPIGAHIRRSNPRDSLDPDPGSDASIAIGKHHRLLRRGREYGAPATPEELADPLPPPLAEQPDRGLHFVCLVGSLSRQFEFIQHTWLNSPKFAGLYDDADPLVGARNQMDSALDTANGAAQCPMGGTFNIPALPVRKRLTGLPRFVTVRGGAYFFMPGIAALKYLASLAGPA